MPPNLCVDAKLERVFIAAKNFPRRFAARKNFVRRNVSTNTDGKIDFDFATVLVVKNRTNFADRARARKTVNRLLTEFARPNKVRRLDEYRKAMCNAQR